MKLFGLTISRAKPTPRKAVIRDYDAGRSSMLFDDFRLDGGWVPSTMAAQLPLMRAKSRQEAKNSPWLKAIIDLFRANVVGESGFRFRATPPYGDGTVDRAAADIITNAFWDWQSSPEQCDIAGMMDFRGFCDMAAADYFRDGEALFRIIRGKKNPGDKYNLALQALNPAMLDAKLNVAEAQAIAGMDPEANGIFNGVELDRFGRPLAYWFSSRSATDRLYTADYTHWAGKYNRIPASDIIHVFDRQLSEQTRGVPGAACVLNRLHMLAKYEEAELVAARKDAETCNTYESQGAVDPDLIADEQTVIGALNNSEAGTDRVVPYGYTCKANSPTRPNASMAAFDKHMLRGVGSGTNTSYNTLANDLEGVSYSSMRSAKHSERDLYMMHQATFIRVLCRRVYREWLKMWLLTPACPLPAEKLDKFAVHEWRGRRWPWVDPNSESRYNEMCRRYGWKTDQTIAEEIGEDFADNLADIKAHAKMATGTYLEGNYAKTTEQPQPGR